MWKRLENRGERSGCFWEVLDWLMFWTVLSSIAVLAILA